MKKSPKFTINLVKLQYLFFFAYLIAISAYQLTEGIDPYIVRISFIGFVALSFIVNKKVYLTSEIKWIIIFWAYYFLSILWAKDMNDTLLCLNSAVQVIAISICLPLMIKDKKNLYIAIKFIVFSLLYTSILLMLRTPPNYWGVTRIGDATGLHQNIIGMRLAIGTTLALYCFHHENSKKSKILYVISMILFIVIALFTGSKKAIVIILLGVCSYELLISRGVKVFVKTLLIVAFVVIFFYIILHNEAIYNVLGDRIESTINTLTGNDNSDASFIERNYYMEKAMKLFSDNPLVGYGGNNFMTHMREIGYRHIAYSHNNYTELLATLGLIGFVIYYYIWIKTEISLLNMYIKNNSHQSLLFLIIITIILIMDYGNVSYYNDFNIILLVLANMLLILDRKEKDETTK